MSKGRYSVQERIGWLGEGGQAKIAKSSAAVIGVGGLGTMSSSLLARAGIGKVVLVDRDHIEMSNLHRQILFVESDCETLSLKAEVAGRRLLRCRSDLEIETVVEDLGYETALRLAESCDILIDGTDNFETRYAINDACVEASTPWIYAGATAETGSVMAVIPGNTPCLRCVFPDPPPSGTLPACLTEGVYGPSVTAIASIQVSLALKVLAGRKDLCPEGMLTLDLRGLTTSRLNLKRNPECECCGSDTGQNRQ